MLSWSELSKTVVKRSEVNSTGERLVQEEDPRGLIGNLTPYYYVQNNRK